MCGGEAGRVGIGELLCDREYFYIIWDEAWQRSSNEKTGVALMTSQ